MKWRKSIVLQAFSLLELLFVMLLIGIIVQMKDINLFFLIQKTKAENKKQQLIDVLEIAKSFAIKYGTDVTVCPSQNGVNCDNVWNQKFIICKTREKTLKRVKADFTQDTIQFSNQKASITWNKFGEINLDASTLTIYPKGQQNYAYKIVINQLGRIRTEELKNSS